MVVSPVVKRKVGEILDWQFHELYRGTITYSIHIDGHFTLDQLEELVKVLREDVDKGVDHAK